MLGLDPFKSRNFAVGNVERLALYIGAWIGSAVNNVVAEVASLIATVAIVAAQFSSSLDRHLASQPPTPRGHQAVAEAKQPTLGRPSVAGVPPREAVAITLASGQSLLEAFHAGIGLASVLVVLIGAASIRNPRRVIRAKRCPGAPLVGAPPDAAALQASA
ncbi:MAG: hypothetical protein JO325_09880 [Solirubrobacterales bacterium]|nr:hypothetical protein [Solirubrobacterales bacterium]